MLGVVMRYRKFGPNCCRLEIAWIKGGIRHDIVASTRSDTCRGTGTVILGD